MEMEPRPPAVAKKLWNIMRIVFYMLKKNIPKKLVLSDDVHIMLNRSKLAGKAIGDHILDQYSAITCRPDDPYTSFISPKEYEFSCSNSPAFPFYRRKHHNYQHYYNRRPKSFYRYKNDDVDVSTVSAVKKVLDMLNNDIVEASPLTFPVARQLRVTDSPFPVKDKEEDDQVDAAAEEFIKKFYKELKSQKRKAAIESPYRDVWGR